MNTDASILVNKFRPKRTGFNVYAEYTQLQLTFLALHSWASTVKLSCAWIDMGLRNPYGVGRLLHMHFF